MLNLGNNITMFYCYKLRTTYYTKSKAFFISRTSHNYMIIISLMLVFSFSYQTRLRDNKLGVYPFSYYKLLIMI